MSLTAFFSRLVSYVFLLIGIFGIIAYDASVADFSESSATEYAQEALLLMITAISFLAAQQYHRYRLLHISLGTLAVAFFIREYNNFAHEYLFPYAWSVAVISILAFLAGFVHQNFARWRREFTTAAGSYAFAILLMGMLILQVFSRLYGLPFVWESLMGDRYLYPVTRASEESIELLGYSILFIGVIEFYLLTKQETNKAIYTGTPRQLATVKVKASRC